MLWLSHIWKERHIRPWEFLFFFWSFNTLTCKIFDRFDAVVSHNTHTYGKSFILMMMRFTVWYKNQNRSCSYFQKYITWKEKSWVKLSSFEFLIIKGSTTSSLMIMIIVLKKGTKTFKLKPHCNSNIRRYFAIQNLTNHLTSA